MPPGGPECEEYQCNIDGAVRYSCWRGQVKKKKYSGQYYTQADYGGWRSFDPLHVHGMICRRWLNSGLAVLIKQVLKHDTQVTEKCVGSSDPRIFLISILTKCDNAGSLADLQLVQLSQVNVIYA